MNLVCPVCLSKEIFTFIELGSQPNSSCLLKENQHGRLDNLTLSACNDCGFIFNSHPVKRESFYDSVQKPTSMFPGEHILDEVDYIVENVIESKSDIVLEIACNDGYFLNALKNAGCGNSYGIEPAGNCVEKAVGKGLNVKKAYFSPEEAKLFIQEHGFPKLVVSRHVLEHIEDLDSFMEGISTVMSDDSVLLLEVPDLDSIKEKGDFSNIWEQHINYFNLATLRILFKRFGLEINKSYIVPFSGGSLVTLSSRSDSILSDEFDFDVSNDNADFHDHLFLNIKYTQDFLRKLKDEGKRIAGFGAGARCSGFLNFTGIYKYLEYVVDEDVRKHNLFMSKSYLEVSHPDRLNSDHVDYCIVLPFNSKKNEMKVMGKYHDFVLSGGTFIETWAEQEDGSVLPLKIIKNSI